jgi:hypothetical protein
MTIKSRRRFNEFDSGAWYEGRHSSGTGFHLRLTDLDHVAVIGKSSGWIEILIDEGDALYGQKARTVLSPDDARLLAEKLIAYAKVNR